MSLSQTVEIITAVSLHGGWVKLLQARRESAGSITLMGLKVRQARGSDEESLAEALRQLVQSLPEPPKEAIGLFSSDAVLTRYLSLPSQDPSELQAMALFQLEGLLPYSIQQCVVSIKPLGPAGEATRVLAVVAHRPDLERLLRVCRLAGLRLTRVASSTEAMGRWHQACWPEGVQASAAWLAAELTPDGLEAGVFLNGSLIYVRHVPQASGDLEEFVARLEETVRAYEKEKVGPSISRVTVGGRLDLLALGALERLETVLGLSVHVVDPLEKSPLRDALAVTAKEVAPEISFSDLLGAVSVPRLLELDLLPLETRLEQARQALFQQGRRTLALLGLAGLMLAGWSGVRVACVFWALHQTQAEARLLEPQVSRVQRRVEIIRDVGSARVLYAQQVRWLDSAARHLVAGMTLQFLNLEGDHLVVARGTGPDLAAVTAYSAALRADPLWEKVTLRAAQVQPEKGNVEFEMMLFSKKQE